MAKITTYNAALLIDSKWPRHFALYVLLEKYAGNVQEKKNWAPVHGNLRKVSLAYSSLLA